MEYSNPNPLNPIILSVSRIESPLPDNRARALCVVSKGDTTIPTGTLPIIIGWLNPADDKFYSDSAYTTEITPVADTIYIDQNTGFPYTYEDSVFVPYSGSIAGFKLVNATDYVSWFASGVTTTNETYRVLTSYFANNPLGNIYVLEIGATGTAGILGSWITNNGNPCYWYGVPQSFLSDATFPTLVSAYASNSGATYFGLEIPSTVIPSQDPNLQALIGSKSLMLVYDVSNATQSLMGAIFGIFGSPIYNVSTANPMTQMQYKTLIGITPDAYSTQTQKELTDFAINFAGTINNKVRVLNGRIANNDPIEFWYSFDLLATQIENYLINALVTGSNVPLQRVGYDQTGIDTLLAIINGRCKTAVANKSVTEFGENLDTATNQIVGNGTFSAIPYYTYIEQSPTDYTNGIYNGFSGVVRIGKYFRQVQINVAIN